MSFTESQKQTLLMVQNSQELSEKQLAVLAKNLDFFNPHATTDYRFKSLWSPLEDAFLVLYAHKNNVFDAAKVLGRTENATMSRLIKIVFYNLPRRFHDGIFLYKSFGLPCLAFYSLYSKSMSELKSLKKKPKVQISVALIKSNNILKGYDITVVSDVKVKEQPTENSEQEDSDNESNSVKSFDTSSDDGTSVSSDSSDSDSSDSDSSDSDSRTTMSVDSSSRYDSESDVESDFSIIE